jgi:hypothetical protein
MKAEYVEGPEVAKKFKQVMEILLRSPKVEKPKATSSKKPKSDKD